MKNPKYIYIALILVGLVLPFIDLTLSAVYGGVAFIALTGVQLSLLPSGGNWVIIGGNPIAIIEGNRKVISIGAVGMLASVLSGFLIKLAWLKYAL